MPSAAITKYFDATENRKIRDDLVFAVDNVSQTKVAIDCGCGAGADIGYLVSTGFFVYGFDIEDESISRCQTRFPKASLVVADASLFFCPKSEFAAVWARIYACLDPDGIFCGSFLGREDTTAGPDYRAAEYWPEVSVFEEEEVKELFANFSILRFNVHRSSGITPAGEPHNWHIVSVVAKKPGSHAVKHQVHDQDK